MSTSSAPTITSSSSMLNMGVNVRGGGAPMPPVMRMGMTTGYQGGQGMHPGVHSMQVNHSQAMGGQIQQHGSMLGPMRVGMPTQPHAVHTVDSSQMGRPGMATQSHMGPQGIHHQMRNTQYSSYVHGQPGVHPSQQPQQISHRMMANPMGHGMTHGGHVSMRAGMPMNPGMSPQVMGGMRMTAQGMQHTRPVGTVTNYNMAPGSQLHPQTDNRFGLSDQQAQMQGQPGMTNSTMGTPQRPTQPAPNMSGIPGVGQGAPGAQSLQGGPQHQPTQNDSHFGSPQTQGEGCSRLLHHKD